MKIADPSYSSDELGKLFGAMSSITTNSVQVFPWSRDLSAVHVKWLTEMFELLWATLELIKNGGREEVS